jgi:hypothetical protein
MYGYKNAGLIQLTLQSINKINMVSAKSILTTAALAAGVLAEDYPYIHIENTQPPANKYVTHCTAMIDGNLAGCADASSEPFDLSCDDGGHTGVHTRSICNTASITIDWETLEVKFKNDQGDIGSCTLDKGEAQGGCYVKNLGEEKGPNCKAVGSRHQYATAQGGGSQVESHSSSVAIYKDGKEIGGSSKDDALNVVQEKWVDITSELPYVFEWKASFHFNFDYCYGKYADQTDLEGTEHHDTDQVLFGSQSNNYCEIEFYC